MTPSKFLTRFSRLVVTYAFLAIMFQCSDEETIQPSTAENPEKDLAVKATAAMNSPADCSTCTYVVPVGKTTIDGLLLGFKPGDVICLNSAATYGYLAFKNINGTAENEITIINCGGPVAIDAPGKPYVVKIYNSKYFRFAGGKVTGTYGIKLSGASGNGLVLGPLATNFIVNHIEVHNVGFAGIMAKTDPTCDDATIRGNFLMKNVYFHSNYIHNTTGEGFYIGHSSYSGVNNATCGLRLPHLIENIKVYRNRVVASGWDGIQMSCATKGAAIFENVIENFSVANKDAQRSGICIGGGTGGVCYSNLINTGNGPGMSVFGLADNLIYNNIIINPSTMGIFCDERTAPGPGYKFLNNTIINPKTEGIRIYAETVPNNIFSNNIIVNPGSYATYGEGAYIMKYKSVILDATNNYFTRNLDELKFINPAANNYRLTSLSPVVDKGRSVITYNILTDFYNAQRSKGVACDIGASEY
jgi:hypothetical protein